MRVAGSAPKGRLELPYTRTVRGVSRVKSMKIACSKFQDVGSLDAYSDLPEAFEHKFSERSKITELVVAGSHEILVAVTEGGLARAFHLTTSASLGCLNPSNEELVHTVLYNKYNSTLIVVYAPYAGALKCNVICCNELKKSKIVIPSWASAFRLIHLTHPAFFEFDETNNRIGVACMETQIFEFWEMSTYKKVFTLTGEQEDRYEEIRVSDSVLAFLKAPQGTKISFVLYDISDGSQLSQSVIEVQPYRDVSFLELCSEFLLLKQDGASLRVYNLIEKKCQKIVNTREMAPLGFVFYDHPINPSEQKAYGSSIPRRFFTICENFIELWRLQDCFALRLERIEVPNLHDTELVSHCSSSPVLAVCGSSINPDNSTPQFASALNHYKNQISEEQIYNYSDNNDCNVHVSRENIEENSSTQQLSSNVPNNPRKSDFTPRSNIVFLSVVDGKTLGTIECPVDQVTAMVVSLDHFKLIVGSMLGLAKILGIPSYKKTDSPELPLNPASS